MARPNRNSHSRSHAVFWYAALIALMLASGALLALIWQAGVVQTKQAMDDGRRFLVHINDGSIEGFKPEPEPPVAETQAPQDAPVSVSANAPAPANPALSESDEKLPSIAADGTKPWQFYAKKITSAKQPMIAIIITGLGQSKSATEAAIHLPENVTLSFNPYAHNLAGWLASAHASGHEIMLDLPLQPSNYPATDPGPQGLLIEKGEAANKQNLHWIMARGAGYTGFAMPQNEVFSGNDTAFKPMVLDMAQHGLLLLLNHEPSRQETKQILNAAQTPKVTSNVWLDEELTPQAIDSRLAALEQAARDKGFAIGMAQAYPISVNRLSGWLQKLAQDGFALVPVTAIAKLSQP